MSPSGRAGRSGSWLDRSGGRRPNQVARRLERSERSSADRRFGEVTAGLRDAAGRSLAQLVWRRMSSLRCGARSAGRSGRGRGGWRQWSRVRKPDERSKKSGSPGSRPDSRHLVGHRRDSAPARGKRAAPGSQLCQRRPCPRSCRAARWSPCQGHRGDLEHRASAESPPGAAHRVGLSRGVQRPPGQAGGQSAPVLPRWIRSSAAASAGQAVSAASRRLSADHPGGSDRLADELDGPRRARR
jgi:hypothetical protein